MTVTPVLAPVSGRAVALADVPDPVFSQGMVGWGAAVQPRAGLVDALAPVDGKLVRLMPHAYVVLTPGGVGLLVHLGLDTVALDGAGFTPLASQGDQLRAGQPVIRYDVPAVVDRGLNPIVLVVVMDERDPAHIAASDPVRTGSDIEAGAVLFEATS